MSILTIQEQLYPTPNQRSLSYSAEKIAMTRMSSPPENHADLNQLYVLRLWRETPDAPWRAVLRSADDSERIGFADIEHLTLYLLQMMEGSAPPGDTDRPAEEADKHI